MLVLDSRDTAHPGSGVRASYEWAVSAIATVAVHLAAQGFVVHLLTDATVRDGTADHPVDIDAALETLARAQPEPEARLDRLTAAAGPFAAGGVMVVAAVMAHDEEALRGLGSTRQPGSRALAFVLDPAKFGGDPGREAPTGALADMGWRTVVCGPHTEIPLAWASLGTGSTVGSPA